MLRLFRSRSLQVDILTAFAAVLIATVALIIGHVYRENRHAVLSLSDQLIEQATRQAAAAAQSHLEPAQACARIAAALADGASPPLQRNQVLSDYGMQIVRAYPHLAMFNVGDERGNFFMHKRMPDGTIATKIIDRTANPPTVTWQYRDDADHIVRTETGQDVRYDPRTRPWYKGAKESGDTFWTDIYIFFTDRRPGVNAAHPIFGPNGQCVGVVSIDIDLGDMSEFLSTLAIGQRGLAYIVNATGNLVAYPNVGETVRVEGEEVHSARVYDVSTPWVRESYRQYIERDKPRFIFHHEGEEFIASFHTLPPPIRDDWRLAVVVPQDDFIGVVRHATHTALNLAGVVLAVAIFIAWLLARSISRPIVALAGETAAIRNFDLDHGGAEKRSHIREIQFMNDAIEAMRRGLRAFRRYVPADLVRELIRTGQGDRLGGVRRRLTICFTDIESFTTICEASDPEEFTLQISEYLDALAPAIMRNGGTIDKFTGDGLMAFWGAPRPDDGQAAHACHAALECQRAVERLNAKWATEGKPPMHTRVGIHTGETIVGNIGSTERMNYTAMGDTVNLASRLEGTNKIYGTRTIVSQPTLDVAGDGFITRPLDIVAVKGRHEGIAIHELVGLADAENADDLKQFCEEFAQAYAAYTERRWADALALFGAFQQKHPDDAPTALYVERCRRYAETPPPDDWDGIEHATTK